MSKHTKRLSRSKRLMVAAVVLASPLAGVTSASAASPTSFHVNFGAQTTKAYPGYTLDYGVAYSDATGQGWEAAADGTSLSMVGNGRERNLAASPDKRYDTQMQMQETASSTGVKTPGQWEHAIANGTYLVTVAVGDASALNSVNRITAEPGTPNSVLIINNFVPTTGNYFSTVTSTVTVADGKLTLNPNGGSNTKIDFVDVVPAPPTDTQAPTASVSLSGNQVSAGVYQGTVTASISAADEVGGSGLKSTTYTLDGGPSTAYTAPFAVTGNTTHTIVVTATDNANNIGTATSTFTIQAPPPDTTAPTATVSLSGTVVSPGVYQGTVTATITSADEVGGSGVASTTYTVDGGASTPYTGPFDVTGVQDHTILVTVTDNATNIGTTTKAFTIVPPPDVFPPTASVSLAGSSYPSGVFFGTVTASISATDGTGSGLASTTYTVDGGASTPYTGPFNITGNATHTIVVTVTDNANNIGTTTKAFTIATTDVTNPTATVSLAGTLVSAGVYTGTVKATIASADETGGSGLASTSYTLDGGASTPYTVPFNITGNATHTIVVTVTDNATNVGTTTSTFSIQPAPDTTSPTASVSLAGSTYPSGSYFGTVTATITSADEPGGSGLASTTYTLDGGASTPYTGPFPVTGVQDHTIVVTATDNANNTVTATKTFTITTTDVTNPTATVSLAGTLVSAGVYTGTVKATIASADETGGSGLASTSYTLDGGASTPYTVPFNITGNASHTIVVTVTDNATNVGTTTSTFTIAPPPDTTKPTASVSLAGTVVSPGVYQGTVTATITSADEVGGSGLASTTYTLDGGLSTPYTAPFPVTGATSHTIVVTATDKANNVGTATSTFTIQADTTPPTASVSLAGTVLSPGNYQGTVTATITAADELHGSGLASTTYTVDGGAVTPYSAPFQVTALGSHTINVTAKDVAGNTGTATKTFVIQPSGAGKLTVVSPDDAVLSNPSTPRLVFSHVRGDAPVPARSFTFTNSGAGPLLVSNLAIGGTNANNWQLATGQATSLTIAPGASAQVNIQFSPTDPTGCASTASPYAIGDVDRNATLTYTTNDPAVPTGTDTLSGVNSCFAGGNSEPVLDQILPELGFTTVVDTQYIDHRYIGPLRYQQGTDEILSPYWTAAVAGQPVSIVPIAHYGSGSATAYQATGYYAQGSAMTSPKSACTTACKTLWQFPPDTINGSQVTYNQDQKLLPGTTTGVTTFTPTGNFGFFSGDYSDVNFSDDGLNIGHDKNNNPLPVPHYLHDMRIYPAYGPGHVVIPNTYIIGIDLSRVPAYKNNDFQDIILLVKNVKPAVNQATVLTASNDIANLTAGGTVTGTCGVTGFDGVMVNTGGTQCNAANIGFSTSGLTLTSTAGQLPNGNQQNALYKSFDATRGAFTIDAQVVGPITQLTSNYQQIAAFFGPDQNNFLKIEAEHNGSSGDPHLTMFYDVKGVTSSVATVPIPSPTTISTLDLIIKGNTNVPDPLPFGDTYGVHGFPLDELTVWYSINGAAPVQIGTTTEFPADVTTWFSRAAKAGILVSNSGSTTPIKATFTKFSVTAP